jgi:hypothetical protein
MLETLGRGEIGYAGEFDVGAPEVARQLPHRRDGELGERSIPPRPGRLLAVGEVEALDTSPRYHRPSAERSA